MLPKSRRILRHDFPTPQAGGFTLQGTHISLRVVPKKPDAKTQVAAVISKKVAKSSPARHTWKRRVYEAVATYEKKHTIKPGAYVFFAKKGSAELSFKQLSIEIEKLMAGGQ